MARFLKLTKFLLHIVFIVLINYFISQKPTNFLKIKKITRFSSDLKHILIWTHLQNFKDSGQGDFINRKCRHINCYLTKNRSLFGDLRYFDAIVFNLQEVSSNEQDLPVARAPHQKYVFAANDSADNYPVCNGVYENFFNWTWTYRTDSAIRYKFFTFTTTSQDNIQMSYQWPDRMEAIIDPVFREELNSKAKGVLTFLDKCQSRSKREVFLKNLQNELSKYNLTVDIFGKCGRACSPRRKSMKPCFWKLRKDYFFYLAMEDSFAKDFMTDSVLYGLKYNSVPIVYGKADYDKFLPPNSYINAMELGEEKLAKTINTIMRNMQIYYEFFAWRNHYAVREMQVLDPCSLCDALNKPEWLEYRWSHSQFRNWWNPEYEDRCPFYSKYLTL
ncbi:alpha-(1,3)-fucosyltransferase C [Bombyx mori]|uniref:Fucosyltransferase n=1 Tax=Bombyx mori TaxID=7091 RepID=A0A8R2AIP7_BOMMO|nr:alpha-(1,3)-fucosyltransferase C [Bombyx mori]